MNGRRDRLATVLRVRRIEETVAAAELARAAVASREAERALHDLRARYDAHRDRDHGSGTVPDRLRQHHARAMQARAIQRGREQVQSALQRLEDQRSALSVRSQAVKAMERLDDRLRDEDLAERLRQEQRELDDRSRRISALGGALS